MARLTRNELYERLFGRGFEDTCKRLTVTPSPDANRVKDATIDVRLGTKAIVIRQSNLTSVDLANRDDIRKDIERSREENIRADYGDSFVLHPQEHVLCSTMEYIAVPPDFRAQVISMASWARLGLSITIGTDLAPGFKGVVTVELTNHGKAPVVLFPGMIIAQMSFHRIT